MSKKVRIVSPNEVVQQARDFVLIDARDEALFKSQSIPGSISMPWKNWTVEKPGVWNYWFGNVANWGRVAIEDVPTRLGALGVSNETRLAVFGSPKSYGSEGRAAWALLYWGANDVALVDGGYDALVRAGALTAPFIHPKGDTADFKLMLSPERRASLEQVRKHIQAEAVFFDVRTPEEFHGKKVEAQKRGGHLPGAKLIEFHSLFTPSGNYIDARTLKELVGDTKAAMSYCTGGVRSALLSVLIEARFGEILPNYDGSMWEYSARPELPLE